MKYSVGLNIIKNSCRFSGIKIKIIKIQNSLDGFFWNFKKHPTEAARFETSILCEHVCEDIITKSNYSYGNVSIMWF